MKPLIHAALLAVLLSVSGCAEYFACKTIVETRPDGTWHYSSCKDQENLAAELGLDDKGKPKNLKVSTTAITSEAVIAASQAVNLKLLELITKLSAAGAGS